MILTFIIVSSDDGVLIHHLDGDVQNFKLLEVDGDVVSNLFHKQLANSRAARVISTWERCLYFQAAVKENTGQIRVGLVIWTLNFGF